MELKDLYDVSDKDMYEISMGIMPPEIKQQVEEMFSHRFGLELIENLFEKCIKKKEMPKEIAENIIRGLRWKYIQLATRYLDENKTEIKNFVWLAREVGAKSN